MSSNVQSSQISIHDHRDECFQVERLALKAIAEWAELNADQRGFHCKLISFYLALICIHTMNRPGALLRQKMVERFSGVRREQHKRMREALIDIGLLEVKESVVGTKKSIRIWLLPAPHQGYESGSAQRTRQESFPVEDFRSTDHLNGSVKRTPIDTTKPIVTTSSVSLRDTSSVAASALQPLPSWPLDQLRRWHQHNPKVVPENQNGTTPASAMMCALTQLSGYTALERVAGGYDKVLASITAMVTHEANGMDLPYESWMTAALGLKRIPSPKDEEPNLVCLTNALRRGARQAYSRQEEREYPTHMSGAPLPDRRERVLIPKGEFQAVLAEMRAEGVKV